MEENSRDYVFFNLSPKERFLVFLCVSYARFECSNSDCKSIFGFKLEELNSMYDKMLGIIKF